ncbi:F0F1 ATP synthase subunit delta [Rossellomorea sp. BNER]|jgi:F-type H+-transporting ATPase subunit delta|uniref:F0F1 ATP synthase subunit delta n=1 Tax=Rossellomorea sp. BNER TaxID=2962031 RepID=UPI003AF2E61A|nr:F0F1 ATP synthase subunit delta [Rossellomorea sp. BNER]
MSSSAVAKRYALALFEISKENKQIETVEAELRVVKQVFLDNKELGVLLETPRLTVQKKKAILKDAFANVSLPVLNTILLLTDRHRGDQIVGVVDAFIELANEEHGIADATVYSVHSLTDDEKNAVSASFSKRVGKKSLRITNVRDEDLLGGLKVHIGNRIFDGSLKGKLNRLERELVR